jgi:hypothetical protein
MLIVEPRMVSIFGACSPIFLEHMFLMCISRSTSNHISLVIRHAYNRRLEVVPPTSHKCPPFVELKLMSCAVVQEGVCVPWTINLTLVSLLAMSGNCSSGYGKDNYVHYGLKVAHRNPKLS